MLNTDLIFDIMKSLLIFLPVLMVVLLRLKKNTTS